MVGKEGDEQFYKELELAEKEQQLPPEIRDKMKKGALRTGYTTGTTASAATKAALHALITDNLLDQVTVSLPKGRSATLKVSWTRREGNNITCAVIKDGGDDPDVTSGAEICATVSFNEHPGRIEIDGGNGVGRVTKSGLGLEIGKPAINSTPMQMLRQAVTEAAREQLKTKGVEVLLTVPRGEEIAKKTDNPRLGILGGISILGTTGIVMPYSTASFAAAIRQGLDVAIAAGADSVVLTTGGRSEDFAKALFPTLPEHCFVQMGDFAGYSVKQCANKNLKKATIAGFIGKLTKMAMGIKQTHVAGSHVNMEFMATLATQCQASGSVIEEIRHANTARHVSEIINKQGLFDYYGLMCRKVHEQMTSHAGSSLALDVIMFEFDGRVIGRYPS
jgi:cobalt-precorrin-5B (C1)-methyltransferase